MRRRAEVAHGAHDYVATGGLCGERHYGQRLRDLALAEPDAVTVPTDTPPAFPLAGILARSRVATGGGGLPAWGRGGSSIGRVHHVQAVRAADGLSRAVGSDPSLGSGLR